MSAGFKSALIGAPSQLWLSSSSSSSFSSTISLFSVVSAIVCMLLCCVQQGLNLVIPSVSMRLRPKRTCSGVECFGGFHIKQRLIYLLWFLRVYFT